jgi:hypothetical protein
MQRVREAAAKAQQAESVSKPRRVRPTAADRERARESTVHRNRVALQAISVILVGPLRWRDAIDHVLAGVETLAVAANVEGDPREVDIYSIPQADVVLIAVDGQRPNHAIEFAMRLQSKDKGTGIALVLPKMSNKNLRTFHTYAGNWSLISASVCGDRTRLSTVLESSGRGISWVDPIISRLLQWFETGTADFDEDYDDIDVDKILDQNASSARIQHETN